MFRKIMQRVLIGFIVGVFLAYSITIIISIFSSKGIYLPFAPDLKEQLGGELKAVVLQYLLSGLLGAVWAAGSLVWEVEEWSILGQTVIHLAVTSIFMLPIAYLTHWMEHSLIGLFSYFAIFASIYLSVWLTRYLAWKKKVQEINQKLAAR